MRQDADPVGSSSLDIGLRDNFPGAEARLEAGPCPGRLASRSIQRGPRDSRHRSRRASPAMAFKYENMKKLRNFLAESFHRKDLEIFLKLEGYDQVAAASVSADQPGTHYFFSVVE